MNSKNIWIIFITLMLCVVATALWFIAPKMMENDSSVSSPTITVTRGNIEETITAQGKLEPKNYVDVGAQVSGQLKSVADIGVVVKKGDLLAEIDPEIYESKVEADQAHIKTLQAQLNQQEAQADLARKQADRNQHLVQGNAISIEALEQTDAAMKVAVAQTAALKAQLEEEQSTLLGDQANLGYTKIYAPMDGTVVDQSVKQGQTVNSSQQAPTIVRIANLNIMTVRAQVPEADVIKLKEGQDVYFVTLGRQDRRWTAKVRQILPTPETINDVVLFDVLVDVDNNDRQLMTGMSTEMFFIIGQAKNALLVPTSALKRRAPAKDNVSGEAYAVRQIKDGSLVNRIVHIGLMNRDMTEIRSGLAEGDKIMGLGSDRQAPEAENELDEGQHP
jgi:macrolide-specific efflux system membrane fusion protein